MAKGKAVVRALNKGAQAAKDLAARTKAATAAKADSVAARETAKRAASPRRAAVDAGVATRAEAVSNARQARAARSSVRRAVGKTKSPAAGKGMTRPQKAVAATAAGIAVGGIAINSDKKMRQATAGKARSGSSRRGGTPMKGKGTPLPMAPASSVSRGGGSAVINRPDRAPARAPKKASVKPAATPAPAKATPSAGDQSYEMHKAYLSSNPTTPAREGKAKADISKTGGGKDMKKKSGSGIFSRPRGMKTNTGSRRR